MHNYGEREGITWLAALYDAEGLAYFRQSVRGAQQMLAFVRGADDGAQARLAFRHRGKTDGRSKNAGLEKFA